MFWSFVITLKKNKILSIYSARLNNLFSSDTHVLYIFLNHQHTTSPDCFLMQYDIISLLSHLHLMIIIVGAHSLVPE